MIESAEQSAAYSPFDPIVFIQECVHARRIVWTYHVNMRLKERFIPRKWIIDSVENYELIEQYPRDKYMPSYLVWSSFSNVIFHILFATDIESRHVRIVTAYRSDPDEWTSSLKNRRRT